MRKEKQLLLDEIANKVQSANAFIVMNYSNLSANAAHELRGQLAKSGAELEIVRKRIFLKAVELAGISLSYDMLQGHIGVIFAQGDGLEATKAVYQFGKENEDRIHVLNGYFDGKLLKGEDVDKLSQLPTLPEMRSQFLGLLEAPMAQFLAVIEALLSSVMHAMDNKAEKENS